MADDADADTADEAPTLDSLEPGDTVRLNYGEAGEPSDEMTVEVGRLRTFRDSPEVHATDLDTGDSIKVYADHYPPVVAREGLSEGRLFHLERDDG